MANNKKPSKPVNSKHVFYSLLERVGTKGRYQTYLILILCVVNYLSGALTMVPSYIFHQQPYNCSLIQLHTRAQCQRYVCQLPPEQRLKFIPQKSINTLATHFGDYRCQQRRSELQQAQSLLFVGRFLGPMALVTLGDLFTRRTILLSNLLINLLGLQGVIFSPSLEMAGVMLGVAMFGAINSMFMSYAFVTECVDNQLRDKCMVLITSFFGVGMLLNIPQYYYIADWRVIMLTCQALPSLLAIIAVRAIVQDTPICLVMRYSPQKACKAFNKIALMNESMTAKGMQPKDITIVKKNHELSLVGSSLTQLHTFTVLDLFRYPSLRLVTVTTTLLLLANSVNYFAPPLMIKELGFDLFEGGLVIGVACLLHYPVCFVLIPKFKRQPTTKALFGAAVISAMGLAHVWRPSNPSPSALFFLFLFYFSVCSLSTMQTIYHSQLFPGQVRVIGTTIANFIKGIMVVFLPRIMASWQSFGFNRMMLFILASVFGLTLSNLLPETHQKIPPEIIYELTESGSQGGRQNKTSKIE